MLFRSRFSKGIRVTFEHGHGNHLSDDWSSTAYWYQTLPSPVLTIPDVDRRLPLRPVEQVVEATAPELTAEQKQAREAAARRMEEFVRRRDALRDERRVLVDAWERGNAKQARNLRRRYDAGRR